jgi:hypothetical protein
MDLTSRRPCLARMCRPLVSVLAAVLTVSCSAGANQRTDGSDRSGRLSVTLASVAKPAGPDWSYSRDHPGRVTLGRLGKDSAQSLSGIVVLSKLPSFESQAEFLDLVREQRGRESGDTRFEDIVREESVSTEDGIWVVRFHIKYKDFGANNLPPLARYLVIEDLGATFRHPKYSGVAVTVALSQRSLPEAPFVNFEAVAEGLIKSVQFHSDPSE